ncbi:hypothetical protein [Cognatitamlana onchidii]|uniref:hypothetical protein n=1 Tax=Cognatitamlana onchidii TaxID=2562860 RepID=UPI0010A69F81|nr:hypothetical protein [Algibacter onchidii]
MKKLSITLLIISLWFSATTYAQKKDSIQQPKEKIEVNKEFDEHGNLIRYDSIYSYSSSSSNMEAKAMDSIMKHFFSNRESMPFRDPFDSLEFGFPSIFPQNFGNFDSIWKQRLEARQKLFDSIFKRHQPKKKQSPTNKI